MEYDSWIGAMYVRLRAGKVSSTEPLADNIMVDFDERKRLLGLELLLSPTVEKEVKAELIATSRRESRRQPGERPRSAVYPMFK